MQMCACFVRWCLICIFKDLKICKKSIYKTLFLYLIWQCYNLIKGKNTFSFFYYLQLKIKSRLFIRKTVREEEWVGWKRKVIFEYCSRVSLKCERRTVLLDFDLIISSANEIHKPPNSASSLLLHVSFDDL